MKNEILINSEGNIDYLYSHNKNQFFILHPLLKYLIKGDEKETNKSPHFDTLGNLDYYRKKLKFLKNAGYFDLKNKEINSFTGKLIDETFFNSTTLIFETTESCNLKCKYCSLGDFYTENTERKNRKLSFAKAKVLIDYYFNGQKSYIPEIEIGFYGGEPLMNINLIKKIVYYLKMIKPNQKYRFFMTTNAVLLDKHYKFLIENKFCVSVSLDGDKKSNEFRVFSNGESSYEKVTKNLNFLREQDPEYFYKYVNLLCVLHSKNNNANPKGILFEKFKLKTYLSRVRSSSVNRKMIEEFKKVEGNKSDFDLLNKYRLVDEPDLKKLETGHIRLTSEYSGVFRSYTDVLDNYKFDFNKFFPNPTCIPFRVRIFLSAEGKIYPCEKIGTKNNLGYINKDNKVIINFEELSSVYNNYRKYIEPICINCYNIDCAICYYSIHNNPNKKCPSFVNEEAITALLSKQLSYIETNNNLFFNLFEK